MNRTKIEWCDYTWNPVTGCWGPGGTAEKPNRCDYCYAEKIAHRFNWSFIDARIIPGERLIPFDTFRPLLWPDRLPEPSEVKKPSRIFVCSMGDLFGDWVPVEWIMMVLQVVNANARHTFQFLTKNPTRYQEFNPWPSNCWLGTTITDQADADERIPALLKADARVRFVSAEPLLDRIDVWQYLGGNRNPIGPAYGGKGLDWLIIGAQTGPGAVQPKPEWVQGLIDQARAAGVPLFLKNNLKLLEWPEDGREFPKSQDA